MSRTRLVPILLSAISLLLASSASARPCGQEVSCDAITLEGPVSIPFPADDPDGLPNIPGGGREVAGLNQKYVEEEFFFSGVVDVFNFDMNPAQRGAAPGDRLREVGSDLPYKTRMLVRRPLQHGKFNGTVVVESMNSTAGFDSVPSWLPSAEYFAREGIVYIGVTTSGNQSIPFLSGGCGGLAPSCGSRYADLVIHDNGQEYELMNQLVTALKGDDPSQIPLPRNFGPVERVFLTGQSQQGASIVTHASEFHFSGIDGYFFMGASTARRIRGTSADDCDPNVPEVDPVCVARLQDEEAKVRTDLPVPVYQGMSEGDVRDGSRRQPDTDTSPFASYRNVEVPGTSHNPIHKSEILGLPLSFFCLNEPFSLADGPIFGSHVWNAMWENMRLQVDQGILPPHAPPIEIVDGVIQRDEFQNALGGVRLPELDLPTNSYFSPNNQGKLICGSSGAPPPPDCIPSTGNPGTDFLLQFIGALACRLNGSLEPLSQEVLDDLYPDHGSYVDGIVAKSDSLMAERFLLEADAKLHEVDAAQSDIGK